MKRIALIVLALLVITSAANAESPIDSGRFYFEPGLGVLVDTQKGIVYQMTDEGTFRPIPIEDPYGKLYYDCKKTSDLWMTVTLTNKKTQIPTEVHKW